MRCKMFSSILGPYPLDSRSLLPVVATKMSPDFAKCKVGWEVVVAPGMEPLG